MRITGGEYGGRILHLSKNLRARPTTDMARESLFNILNNHFDFEEIRVLDLFSGTGSISFEFSSRGCKDITLLDSDSIHLEAIRKNALILGAEGLHIIKADVYRFLQSTTGKYDIVFADPPYDDKKLIQVPDFVLGKLLKPDGWFILEHSKNQNFSKNPYFFELRNYGAVHFSFFKESKIK